MSLQQITINEAIITPDTVFKLTTRSEQLAEHIIAGSENENISEDADAETLADELVDTKIRIDSITKDPGGVKININTEYSDNPTEIHKFAVENLLKDGSLKVSQ